MGLEVEHTGGEHDAEEGVDEFVGPAVGSYRWFSSYVRFQREDKWKKGEAYI